MRIESHLTGIRIITGNKRKRFSFASLSPSLSLSSQAVKNGFCGNDNNNTARTTRHKRNKCQQNEENNKNKKKRINENINKSRNELDNLIINELESSRHKRILFLLSLAHCSPRIKASLQQLSSNFTVYSLIRRGLETRLTDTRPGGDSSPDCDCDCDCDCKRTTMKLTS